MKYTIIIGYCMLDDVLVMEFIIHHPITPSLHTYHFLDEDLGEDFFSCHHRREADAVVEIRRHLKIVVDLGDTHSCGFQGKCSDLGIFLNFHNKTKILLPSFSTCNSCHFKICITLYYRYALCNFFLTNLDLLNINQYVVYYYLFLQEKYYIHSALLIGYKR